MRKLLFIGLLLLSYSGFSQGILTSTEVKDAILTITPSNAQSRVTGNLPIQALKVKRLRLDTLLKVASENFATLVVNKADLTYVNTQLVAKTTTAQVTTIVAPKMDSTRVKTLLTLKANTTDVNDKVSTATFNSVLSTKANSSDLALKENTADVNAKLNFKVNNSLFADTTIAIRNSINTKSSIAYANLKFHNIFTKAQLIAFTDSEKANFDGSEWERKAGNVASNGGAFAGTIVQVSTSFYWQRKFDSYNPAWWGVVGSGNVDDTQAANNCMQYVCANGGGSIDFNKNSTFLILGSILVGSNVIIDFHGSKVLSNTISTLVPIFQTAYLNASNILVTNQGQPISTNLVKNTTVRNVNVSTCGLGFNLYGFFSLCKLENIDFFYCRQAIIVEKSFLCTFKNIKATSGGASNIAYPCYNFKDNCNNILLEKVSAVMDYGFLFEQLCTSITLNNCDFEGGPKGFVFLGSQENLIFDNGYYEACQGTLFDFSACTTANVSFKNSYMNYIDVILSSNPNGKINIDFDKSNQILNRQVAIGAFLYRGLFNYTENVNYVLNSTHASQGGTVNFSVDIFTSIPFQPNIQLLKFSLKGTDNNASYLIFGEVYGTTIKRYDTATALTTTISNANGYNKITITGFNHPTGAYALAGNIKQFTF